MPRLSAKPCGDCGLFGRIRGRSPSARAQPTRVSSSDRWRGLTWQQLFRRPKAWATPAARTEEPCPPLAGGKTEADVLAVRAAACVGSKQWRYPKLSVKTAYNALRHKGLLLTSSSASENSAACAVRCTLLCTRHAPCVRLPMLRLPR